MTFGRNRNSPRTNVVNIVAIDHHFPFRLLIQMVNQRYYAEGMSFEVRIITSIDSEGEYRSLTYSSRHRSDRPTLQFFLAGLAVTNRSRFVFVDVLGSTFQHFQEQCHHCKFQVRVQSLVLLLSMLHSCQLRHL